MENKSKNVSERIKNFLKKNKRSISYDNEAKYYPNSKREPVKPIFDFRKKYPGPKIEPGKPPKETPEQIKKYYEQTMGSDTSPIVINTETGEKTYGRPKKYSLGKMVSGDKLGLKKFITEKFTGTINTNQNLPIPERSYFNDLIKIEPSVKSVKTKPLQASNGELADLIGPSLANQKPKGSVSPKVRAYDDEFMSEYGAGVNVTTKKGVSFDFDVDKTEFKKSDYKEPESYKASVSKKGDKLSYGVSGTKKGKSRSFEAGLTIKYNQGGMNNCRGMGKAIRGAKFSGVK